MNATLVLTILLSFRNLKAKQKRFLRVLANDN